MLTTKPVLLFILNPFPLIGNECRALAVQVDESMRRAVLIDVLTVYGATGKAIIFTKTKRAADEVAAGVALTIPCQVSIYFHDKQI